MSSVQAILQKLEKYMTIVGSQEMFSRDSFGEYIPMTDGSAFLHIQIGIEKTPHRPKERKKRNMMVRRDLTENDWRRIIGRVRFTSKGKTLMRKLHENTNQPISIVGEWEYSDITYANVLLARRNLPYRIRAVKPSYGETIHSEHKRFKLVAVAMKEP